MKNKEAEKLKKEFIKWYETEECAFRGMEPYLISNWWLKKMREKEYRKEEKIRLNWLGYLVVIWFMVIVVGIFINLIK